METTETIQPNRVAQAEPELLLSLLEICDRLSCNLDLKDLLWQVLKKSCDLTWSDAGSIYLVEREDQLTTVCFTVSYNASQPDRSLESFALPMTTNTLVGYVALTAEILNLEDVYDLPTDAPYRHHSTFDADIDYRTRSALVLPLLDHQRAVIGVMQLLNRKTKPNFTVIPENIYTVTQPYSQLEVDFLKSLASITAIAIERIQLLAQL
jgi:GAF domain-containing protein